MYRTKFLLFFLILFCTFQPAISSNQEAEEKRGWFSGWCCCGKREKQPKPNFEVNLVDTPMTFQRFPGMQNRESDSQNMRHNQILDLNSKEAEDLEEQKQFSPKSTTNNQFKTEKLFQISQNYQPGFSIGFEIETNTFKIEQKKEDDSTVYFNIKNKDHTLWQFTCDTIDAPIEENDLRNLECKTLDAIESHDDFLNVSKQITDTLKLLDREFDSLSDGSTSITFHSDHQSTKLKASKNSQLKDAKNLVELMRSINVPIEWIYNKSSPLKHFFNLHRPNTQSEQKKKNVRPQITVRVPIAHIPDVVNHLYETYHPASISQKFITNTYWNKWQELKNPQAKGFACLFSLYIYRLFDYADHEKTFPGTPGLKTRLPLMSRGSISNLYKFVIEDREAKQELFDYFDTSFEKHKDKLVIPYHTSYKGSEQKGTPISDENRVILAEHRPTLSKWIESLKIPKDYLSPPKLDYKKDPMGLYTDITPGTALLEIRCYPKTAETIGTLLTFLQKEGQWFKNMQE